MKLPAGSAEQQHDRLGHAGRLLDAVDRDDVLHGELPAGREVHDVADLPKGKQATIRYTIEIEDEAKPACVAETVVLLLP